MDRPDRVGSGTSALFGSLFLIAALAALPLFGVFDDDDQTGATSPHRDDDDVQKDTPDTPFLDIFVDDDPPEGNSDDPDTVERPSGTGTPGDDMIYTPEKTTTEPTPMRATILWVVQILRISCMERPETIS